MMCKRWQARERVAAALGDETGFAAEARSGEMVESLLKDGGFQWM